LTTPGPASEAARAEFDLAIAPFVYYHIINETVKVADLKDGQNLPSFLPGAEIGVGAPPQAPHVTFHGAVNESNPTGANTSATLVSGAQDIPVVGHPDIFLDVVDSVLYPPEAVYNQTLAAIVAAAQAGGGAGAPAGGAAASAPAGGANTTTAAPAGAAGGNSTTAAPAEAAAPNSTAAGA
jgi:hypothetical protein